MLLLALQLHKAVAANMHASCLSQPAIVQGCGNSAGVITPLL